MSTLLDQMLEPLMDDLDAPRARKLAALRADPKLQAQVDQLADKANEGTLSESERAEYDKYLAAWHLMSLMQRRARRFLKESGES
ncbi:MAG: hypothetical protein IT428_27615 [Planctomycetaceae bacterium]|nr:hypothetical protein [Planctomycetaceae bacterium]